MDTRKYNLGWALLKLWMCFEVVLVHAWSLSTYSGAQPPAILNFLSEVRAYCVPVFMLITFILAAERFASNDGTWLKKRFVRLLTPFAFWSVLAFVTWRLLAPFFPAFCMDPANGAFWTPACANKPEPISFVYLLYQALGTTRTLGSQMWFQAVLIILTALFALFFRFVRPRFVFVGLAVVFIGATMAEHSGLNRWLFEGFRYEVCNPLGRIIPMSLYAAAGLWAGLRLLPKRLVSLGLVARWLLVVGALAVFAFLLSYDVFVTPPGFYYRGFKMFFVAAALVIAFGALPLEAIPEGVKRVLVWASRFSMGVYFAHIYVGKLLESLLFPTIGILPRSFAGAVIVFLASFVLCVAISRIPGKRAKTLVT